MTKGDIRFRPVDEDDHLMTKEEFINAVDTRCIIDYDGEGDLATETEVSNVSIVPSHCIKWPSWATHVCWYNR